MTILQCKMCGANLEIIRDSSVVTCEYCGTSQTISTSRDEIITNLYNRANDLRIKAEFDRAEKTYEKILELDNTEAEAHWGIILCRYGIEYVEDPETRKRIPTCHRTSYESIVSDSDYIAAVGSADDQQKKIYESEAKIIDGIQKNILEIVKNEPPFDVFICYKETDENGNRTIDSVIANDIYHQLTLENQKVFYAPITLEDKLGREYEPYIFAALNTAKVMLVIGTKEKYFQSAWVKNEWSRFLKICKKDRSRILIPCYRDMDAYDLPDEFAHLQAQDMSKIGFINDIVRGIKKNVKVVEEHIEVPVVRNISNSVQLILEDDIMYEGGVFANIPHGSGKAIYKDGTVYEGEWSRGKRNGQGKCTYSDRIYSGAWVDDKRHGQGKIIWNKGGEWTGEFRDEERWNGAGTWYYTDGKYIGPWANGKRHGQGKLIWDKGGEWTGEFKDDKSWNGTGTRHYSDGKYEGPLVNGKRHGQGKLIWNKGGEWTGEFRDEEHWNGAGTWYYTDGKYIGPWANGKRHGQGKFIWNKGGEWVGQFRNDKFYRGCGVMYYNDGSKRETEWVSGGCYVATCVYGSYDCPEVWTLRRFRDDTLASNIFGRAFIRIYYAISPTVVRLFGERKGFKKFFRKRLDRLVLKLRANKVENTPYTDKDWS